MDINHFPKASSSQHSNEIIKQTYLKIFFKLPYIVQCNMNKKVGFTVFLTILGRLDRKETFTTQDTN